MAKRYEVGYGKPPKHTQFKPGESGNRKGRPKKSENLPATLQKVLGKRIPVREGDKVRRVPMFEAMLLAAVVKATKGDQRAFMAIMKLAREAGLFERLPAEEGKHGVLFFNGTLSPEDWDEKAAEHYGRNLPPENKTG